LRTIKCLGNKTIGKNRKKFTKLSWLRSYLETNQSVHSENCWSSCRKLMKTIFTQSWVQKYLWNKTASQERQYFNKSFLIWSYLDKFLSARWDDSWIWCENLRSTKPIPLRTKKCLGNETTGKNRRKFTKLSWVRPYLGTNQSVHPDNCWSSCRKLMKTIFTQSWVKKYLGNETASQERQYFNKSFLIWSY